MFKQDASSYCRCVGTWQRVISANFCKHTIDWPNHAPSNLIAGAANTLSSNELPSCASNS